MTVTMDWTLAVGLLVWSALVFWLGRATAGGRSRDLMGPPPDMPMASPPTLRADQIEAIRGEVSRGNKIAAIKLYREATGLGLAEAKAAVEAMES